MGPGKERKVSGRYMYRPTGSGAGCLAPMKRSFSATWSWTEGIEAEGLDVQALAEHRVVADRISIRQNHIYVFRDRRLPLEPGDKRLPAASLTKLNNPAENLGQLHLESGMLNRLDFQFSMSAERSTGEVTGRYHELVVQKLRKDGKVDELIPCWSG